MWAKAALGFLGTEDFQLWLLLLATSESQEKYLDLCPTLFGDILGARGLR